MSPPRTRDCFVGRAGPPSSVDAWRSVAARTGPWAAAACRALGIRAIVSGGQDGVDVGALRWAAALGLPAGGWAPRSMRSESGRIVPDVARLLREHPSSDYAARTCANVRAADAVLVVAAPGTAGPGTAFTLREAAAARRPALELGPGAWSALELVAWLRWLPSAPDTVLMVAGPRASRWVAGEREVVRLLGAALASVAPPVPLTVERPAMLESDPLPVSRLPVEVERKPWGVSGVALW